MCLDLLFDVLVGVKAQMCLHSGSKAFVGQTYLIKKEKRGKVGRFVLCRKKCSATCYWWAQTGFVFEIINHTANLSAGFQRQALTIHAEKCDEIMRDFLKSPEPCVKAPWLYNRKCLQIWLTFKGGHLKVKSKFSPYALLFFLFTLHSTVSC